MPLYILRTDGGPLAAKPIETLEDQALWNAAAPLLERVPLARSTQPPKAARTSIWAAPDLDDFVFEVLDSVTPEGPHLVSMTEGEAAKINASATPLRTSPVKRYRLPSRTLNLLREPNPPKETAPPATFEVVCLDTANNMRLPGCRVVALTDVANYEGVAGKAEDGSVKLTLPSTRIAALYVLADHTYWGSYRTDVALTNGKQFWERVPRIDPTTADAVRHRYPRSQFAAGVGIKVGVVDTGIGPHPNLRVDVLRNTVSGEPKEKGEDGQGHGTHVAGLIAARSDNGPQGLAPGVVLHSYRAFGEGEDTATDYAIMKAILCATWDRCDIINVSVESDEEDDCVRDAVAFARDNGALVVVAAGNGAGTQVNLIATYPGAVAVTALGDLDCFPSNSIPAAEVPALPDLMSNRTFMAAFSNHGGAVDAVAPGVGVLSTRWKGGYEARSGTSMATPVISGALASLLSRHPDLLAADRDRDRSARLEQLLRSACITAGFPKAWQGDGWPDPAKV